MKVRTLRYFPRSRLVVLALVCALSGATAGRARAAYIHSYASGFVNASPGTAAGSANYSNSLTAEGQLTLSSGLLQASEWSGYSNNGDAPRGTRAEGKIFGAVAPLADRLFSLGAYSYGYDNDFYLDAGAYTAVSLGFRDVIRYSGSNPPPVLTLTFRADGLMSFSPYKVNTSEGTSGVEFGYQFSAFDNLSGFLPGSSNPPQTRTIIGWPGNATPTENAVDMTFSHDLNYNPEIGGYAFNLNVYTTTSVFAWNRQGRADSDFLHTVALKGVTLGNGGAVDPALLTFDSGLSLSPQVTPTPAPSGLVLLATGAGFLPALLRKRRRKAAPAPTFAS